MPFNFSLFLQALGWIWLLALLIRLFTLSWLSLSDTEGKDLVRKLFQEFSQVGRQDGLIPTFLILLVFPFFIIIVAIQGLCK